MLQGTKVAPELWRAVNNEQHIGRYPNTKAVVATAIGRYLKDEFNEDTIFPVKVLPVEPPDYIYINWSEDEAAELARVIEITGHADFAKLTRAALEKLVE